MSSIIRSSLLLVIALSLLLPAIAQEPKPARKDVDVEKFDKLRKEPKHVVLDVRTAEEHKAGHIPGAVLIDVRSPEFAKKIAELDKSKTYLVHCASGRRSVTACEKLSAAGFNDLYNLEGGIQAWKKAGKPVEK